MKKIISKMFVLSFLIQFCITANDKNPLSYMEENLGDNYITIFLLHELCDYYFMAPDHFCYIPQSCRHKALDLKKIKKGDLILVQGAMLKDFFASIHPKIEVSYCIATFHNDVSSPGKFESYLNDPKIIAWFGINPTIENHPKFFAIPVAIPQDYIFPRKTVQEINQHFAALRKRPKNKLLYMNYCPYTNPIRDKITAFFIQKPFCTVGKFIPIFEFWDDISQHKFTLSPPGYGIDCYRTWECILLGSIPIVISSPLNVLYKDLPILIINNWEQITEDFLNEKYEEFLSKKFSLKKLYKEYWQELVTQVKNRTYA